MADATDKLLDLIPVAITAKIAQSFIPGQDKKTKKSKGIFDFGG